MFDAPPWCNEGFEESLSQAHAGVNEGAVVGSPADASVPGRGMGIDGFRQRNALIGSGGWCPVYLPE